MLRSSLLAALVGCAFVLAAPTVNTDANEVVDDVAILNFALTLEHLENAFYTQCLATFDAKDFAKAGYPDWVRGRFEQIAMHEATHVRFLEGALGDKATKPCEYKFPCDDPRSFSAISMALETVGTSAYLGAAPLIENKSYLADAGSILATEARQAAWVSSAVLKGSAWDGPFETPLGATLVFSLASQFIVSCPASNPPLPVSIKPTLSVSVIDTSARSAKLTFDRSADNKQPLCLAYFTGLDVKFTDIKQKGDEYTTTVPANLQGTVYVAVVDCTNTKPTDMNTLTGATMLEFPFSSSAKNVA
ncbi:unnamed protein product [Somion occarium]|uniref:Uncharacterized protein n=1 Tax=Somion occarium TaxID=3059160 RepID=A0ABP1DQV5_9APHY